MVAMAALLLGKRMGQQPPASVLDLRSVVQHWPDPGLLGPSRELLSTPATPTTPRRPAGLAGPTKGLRQPARESGTAAKPLAVAVPSEH